MTEEVTALSGETAMLCFLLNGSNVSAVYVSMFMPIGWCCYQFWSEKLLLSWATELQPENCSKSKNDDFECSTENGTPVSSCRRYREHCGSGAGKKVRTEGGTEYYGTLSYRHGVSIASLNLQLWLPVQDWAYQYFVMKGAGT